MPTFGRTSTRPEKTTPDTVNALDSLGRETKVQEIALNREITRAYALRAGSARRLPGNRAINRWPRLIERVIARNAGVSERKSFIQSPAGGEAGRLARGRERLARPGAGAGSVYRYRCDLPNR